MRSAVPKLRADFTGGSGKVVFPTEWKTLPALLRADILKDWFYEIQQAYDTTVIELHIEMQEGRVK